MVRERVDVYGRVRQMEPEQDIDILQLSAKDIGLLKEAPARRWLSGQEHWDKKFKSSAKRVIKARKKNEEKYQKLLARAYELGLIHVSDDVGLQRASSGATGADDGKIQPDRRWGPLDLDEEDPPPSAIAKRRDTVRKPRPPRPVSR